MLKSSIDLFVSCLLITGFFMSNLFIGQPFLRQLVHQRFIHL